MEREELEKFIKRWMINNANDCFKHIIPENGIDHPYTVISLTGQKLIDLLEATLEYYEDSDMLGERDDS